MINAQVHNFQEATTWITADLHLSHLSLQKNSRKQFNSVEQMDEVIRENLKVVSPGDRIIVVGDLTYGKDKLSDIKCLRAETKYLIRGNHDSIELSKSKKWFYVADYMEARFSMDDGTSHKVIFSHYPMVSWNGAMNSIHLHGHTHGIIKPVATEKGGRCDVGVDVWDFKPIRLRDVLKKLSAVRENSCLKVGVDY